MKNTQSSANKSP